MINRIDPQAVVGAFLHTGLKLEAHYYLGDENRDGVEGPCGCGLGALYVALNGRPSGAFQSRDAIVKNWATDLLGYGYRSGFDWGFMLYGDEVDAEVGEHETNYRCGIWDGAAARVAVEEALATRPLFVPAEESSE